MDRQVLKFLATLDPLEVEPASEVRYPDGWGHIPERREAYWYYAAVAEANGNKEAVLVRRPKGIPAGWRWVELFSAQRRLRDCLSVAQGDTITVRLTAG